MEKTLIDWEKFDDAVLAEHSLGGPELPTNMQKAQAHYIYDKLREALVPRLIVQSPGGTGKTWLMATLAALYNEAAENDARSHIISPSNYLMNKAKRFSEWSTNVSYGASVQWRNVKGSDLVLVDECDKILLDNPDRVYKQSNESEARIVFFTATLGDDKAFAFERRTLLKFSNDIINFEILFKFDSADVAERFNCEHSTIYDYKQRIEDSLKFRSVLWHCTAKQAKEFPRAKKITLKNIDACRKEMREGTRNLYIFNDTTFLWGVDYQSDGSGLDFLTSKPFSTERDFTQAKMRVGRWNDRKCGRYVYGQAID